MHRLRGWLRRRPSRLDERGAAAIVMSLVIVFIAIPIAALTVDIGMQRVARKDAQAIADTAALDTARALAASPSMNNTQLTAVATTTASGGSGLLGSTPTMAAYAGYIDPAATYVSDQGLGCNAATYNTYFTSVPSGKTANAVLVVASGSVSRVFGQAIGAGAGSVCRSSIAKATSTGCFEVRSYLLGLSTANSTALNGLLGNALGTSVLGYNGLATSAVSIPLLAAQLGVGSPSQFASTTVTASQLLTATATVLSQNGGSSATVTLLNSILAGMSASTKGTSVALSKLVDVGTTGAALTGSINLLDLVGATASIVNGTNFVTVPGITVTIPNVGSTTVQASLIEGPQMACGNGTARTGQLKVKITANFSGQTAGSLLTLAGISSGPITITASLANASATMNSLHCTNAVPDSMSLTVTDQTVASLNLDYGGLTVSTLNLLGISLLPISLGGINATVSQPNPAGTYTLALPQYYDPNFYATPQTSSPLPQVTTTQLQVLGLTLLNAPTLAGLLNPLLTNLNTALTSTVLPALGITLAGADLAAVGPTSGHPEVSAPSCTTPGLA